MRIDTNKLCEDASWDDERVNLYSKKDIATELRRLYAIEDATTRKVDTNELLERIERLSPITGYQEHTVELLRNHILATTPFKDRAEVETYLKGKGFEETWKGSACWVRTCDVDSGNDAGPVVEYFEGAINITSEKASFGESEQTTILTPALLEKILEAK